MDKETKIILSVAAFSLVGFWLYKRYFNQKRTLAPCPDGKKLVDSICLTNPYRVINTTTATIGGDVSGRNFNAGDVIDVLREDIIIGRTSESIPVVIVLVDGEEQAIVSSDVVKL